MEELLQRAKDQRIINSTDSKRLMFAPHYETEDLTIIDSINGHPVPSLFKREESLIERAKLQGALNLQDYGKMSPEEKQQVSIARLKLDREVLSVDVFPPDSILRYEFDKMNEAQQRDTINKRIPIIDKEPTPDLALDDVEALAKQLQSLIPKPDKETEDNGDGDGTD